MKRMKNQQLKNVRFLEPKYYFKEAFNYVNEFDREITYDNLEPQSKKEKYRKQKEYLNTIKGRFLKRLKDRKRTFIKKNCIIEVYTEKEWVKKLRKTKGVCPQCKRFVGIKKLEKDHIYPIVRAGEDYFEGNIKRIYGINDIQPLCKSCNCKKLIKNAI